MVKIVETPRDGFQGLKYSIDTQKKIEYINLLLKCGFHTVEVGSFVSQKVIPQMADTAKVIEGLDLTNTNSKVAVLVATESGGVQAVRYDQIDQLFFPFSISPTFLKKNINKSIEESIITIYNLQNLCLENNKELIVYLTMAFGNPYGDAWSIESLIKYVEIISSMGLSIFPLSDIMGDASPEVISLVFKSLRAKFPDIEFGLHLHSLPENRVAKVNAAYGAGIRRFDTVLNGLGGCPQTGKELVGNLPLDVLLSYCSENKITNGIDKIKVNKASALAVY